MSAAASGQPPEPGGHRLREPARQRLLRDPAGMRRRPPAGQPGPGADAAAPGAAAVPRAGRADPAEAGRPDRTRPRRQQAPRARVHPRRPARAGLRLPGDRRWPAVELDPARRAGLPALPGGAARRLLRRGRARRRQHAAAPLAGTDLRFTGDPDRASVDAAMGAVVAELHAQGRRPYLVPRGGATPLGALGYLRASVELAAQLATLGERPRPVAGHRVGRNTGRARGRRRARPAPRTGCGAWP